MQNEEQQFHRKGEGKVEVERRE